MKIVILGGTGMLGFQMVRECAARDLDYYTLLRNPAPLPDIFRQSQSSRIKIIDDASNWDLLESTLTEIKPDYVINCIGIVKQSHLADAHLDSISINSLLPHKLEYFGQKIGYRFIHISTDCVFRGDRGNYAEEDVSDAVDLYGRSKYLGEVDYGCGITLRTSIIGHEISRPHTGLLEWFLAQSGSVDGYPEAIFSGFTTNELSRIILDKVIFNHLKTGLYHVASQPISKYELLKLFSEVYEMEIEIKPSYRVQIDRTLNGSNFDKICGYQAPDWLKMIEQMKNERISLVNHK